MRLINSGRGNGEERGVPTIKRRGSDGKVREFVRCPPLFSGCTCPKVYDGEDCRCGRERMYEHKPGNAYLALPSYGFYCIEKNQSFEVPPGATKKAIMDMCPHLVPEEDHEFASSQEPAAEPKADGKSKKQ